MTWATLGLMVALAASPKVSVEYRGTLRDALKLIAQKGEINLVVVGDLSQPAEVLLKDVSAEEALRTVANAYQLDLKQSGSIWTLREAPGEAKAEAPLAAKAAELAAAAKEGAEHFKETAKAQAEALKASAKAQVEALKHSAEDRAGEPKEGAQDDMQGARELAEQAREAVAASDEFFKEHASPMGAQAREAAEHAAADVNEQRAAFGGSVVVKANERVDSAVAFGGNVTVEEGATVEEDAVAFGGDVVLEKNSRVEGDAVAWGGRVKKATGAVVNGEIVSMGGNGIGNKLAAGAFKMHGPVSKVREDSSPGFSIASFLLLYALSFGMGFVFLLLIPTRMKTMEAELTRNPLPTLGVGVVGAVLFIPVMVMMCLTVVGIPVALVMFLLLPFGIAMGFTAIANVVGMHLPLPPSRRTQAAVLALGLAVLLGLVFIPVVGTLIFWATFVLSLGVLIRTRLGNRGQGQPVPEVNLFSSPPPSQPAV